MNRRLLSALAGLIAVFAIAAAGSAAATSSANGTKLPSPLPAHGQQAVCTAFAIGLAHCDAHVVTHENGAAPLATPTWSSGYSPQNLAAAYKWASPTGSAWSSNGQTIAIVDAYDNPNAASDLATYRTQFGLPPCTAANGCFRKVNQRGGTAPP